MKPKLEELVRRAMRNLSPDYVEDESEEPLTGYITKDEAEEVQTEIARRVYAAFDTLRPRLAARLPHLTDAQLDVLDRELQRALAPLGKRPGFN
jgi:phage terminase Nu1 subunit (DNA packaging protein)